MRQSIWFSALAVAALTFGESYDPDVPDKCVIETITSEGGNCRTYVQCEETDQQGDDMGAWNVCYLGGRQYFTHDEIGDCSITYTQAGGQNGVTEDGLHHPVIQFAQLDNWEEVNFEDILAKQGDKETGNLVLKKKEIGPKDIIYEIGIPKLARASTSAFGISLIMDDADKPGTAHVVQYQKNEFGTGAKYQLEAQIFDGAGDQIGHTGKTEVDDSGFISLASKLPNQVVFQVGAVDSDPLKACYASDCWTCDDGDGGAHACNVGNGPRNGFENGDREGDMGFTC
ncbi:Uu.00g127760.m01.CDS01 [Anthostomella pinea]|uniref:Uu.00g127760.m01.CDS01 n=1 Tax=Anthostomella pinea TaxID=933095 RepID=A0AAI8VI85_9PEZI|nr:Uu.00g127760.m01.CDS01 [Anthostomella pinea]